MKFTSPQPKSSTSTIKMTCGADWNERDCNCHCAGNGILALQGPGSATPTHTQTLRVISALSWTGLECGEEAAGRKLKRAPGGESVLHSPSAWLSQQLLTPRARGLLRQAALASCRPNEALASPAGGREQWWRGCAGDYWLVASECIFGCGGTSLSFANALARSLARSCARAHRLPARRKGAAALALPRISLPGWRLRERFGTGFGASAASTRKPLGLPRAWAA